MTYIVENWSENGIVNRRPGLVCTDMFRYREKTKEGEFNGIRGASFDFLRILAVMEDNGATIFDPFLLHMIEDVRKQDAVANEAIVNSWRKLRV